MVQSERSTSDIITELEDQARMQAIADLSRADALQVVNYGIRQNIEQHLNSNYYIYNSQLATFSQIKNDFSNYYFGASNGSILARQIAVHLTNIIAAGPKTIEGFKVELCNGVSCSGADQLALQEALEKTFQATIQSDQDTFLEIINCAESIEPQNCTGTFYVNLDFSKIDDKTYEQLPQIKVTNVVTQRTIVEPVISRGVFRIYVPNRVFKALRYAYKIVKDPAFDVFGNLHNELAGLGLGLCDAGKCHYRVEAFGFGTPSQDDAHICASESYPAFFKPNELPPNNVDVTCTTGGSVCAQYNALPNKVQYNPIDRTDMGLALEKLVSDSLTQSVINVALAPDADGLFTFLNNNTNIQVKVITNAIPSKTIRFDPSTAFPDQVAYCTQVTNTSFSLVFSDDNPNYVVVDARKPLRFEIRVQDGFSSTAAGSELCESNCISSSGFLETILGGIPSTPCAQVACTPAGTYGYPPPPPPSTSPSP